MATQPGPPTTYEEFRAGLTDLEKDYLWASSLAEELIQRAFRAAYRAGCREYATAEPFRDKD